MKARQLIRDQFGSTAPIRHSLLTEDLYLISGARNLNLVWRNSQWLTAKAGYMIGLESIPDTPKSSHGFYRADDSGIGKLPLPRSNVLPQNRFWHLTHQSVVDSLPGSRPQVFIKHFTFKLRWENAYSRAILVTPSYIPSFFTCRWSFCVGLFFPSRTQILFMISAISSRDDLSQKRTFEVDDASFV